MRAVAITTTMSSTAPVTPSPMATELSGSKLVLVVATVLPFNNGVLPGGGVVTSAVQEPKLHNNNYS